MESIITQQIHEDIRAGIIQKSVNEAIEEASRLMDEEGCNIFHASNHVTFFTNLSKEEAVMRIFRYRANGQKHNGIFTKDTKGEVSE